VPGQPGQPQVPGQPGTNPGAPGAQPAPGTRPTGGRGPFDPAASLIDNPWWRVGTAGYGLAAAPSKIASNRRALPAWRLYNRIVRPISERYGPNHPTTLRTYLRWQQLVSNSAPIDEVLPAVGARGYPSNAGLGTRLFRGVGKALGPVGVATSAYGLTQPAPHEGWRGTGDRAAQVGGLFSGGIATAALLGATIAPPVAIAAAVVGTGVALWTLGNLAWDYRHEIAGAVGDAGTWVADRAGVAAEFMGDTAETIGDGFEAAGDVASDVGDALTFWD
jgi:hypothetical protein